MTYLQESELEDRWRKAAQELSSASNAGALPGRMKKLKAAKDAAHRAWIEGGDVPYPTQKKLFPTTGQMKLPFKPPSKKNESIWNTYKNLGHIISEVLKTPR